MSARENCRCADNSVAISVGKLCSLLNMQKGEMKTDCFHNNVGIFPTFIITIRPLDIIARNFRFPIPIYNCWVNCKLFTFSYTAGGADIFRWQSVWKVLTSAIYMVDPYFWAVFKHTPCEMTVWISTQKSGCAMWTTIFLISITIMSIGLFIENDLIRIMSRIN